MRAMPYCLSIATTRRLSSRFLCFAYPECYRYVVWMKGNFRSIDPFNEDLVFAEELYDDEQDPPETQSFVKGKSYVVVMCKGGIFARHILRRSSSNV